MRGFFVGCYFRRSHDRSAPEQVGEETSSGYELFESVVVHQSFPEAVEHLLRCFGFEKGDEFVDCFFIQFDLQVAQFAGQDFLAVVGRFADIFVKCGFYLVAGARGFDEFEPLGFRFLVFAGDYLHLVAALEYVVEGKPECR